MKREIQFAARGQVFTVEFTTTGAGRDILLSCSHWELIFDLQAAGEVIKVEPEIWRLPAWSPSALRENQKQVRADLIEFGGAEGRRMAIKEGRAL